MKDNSENMGNLGNLCPTNQSQQAYSYFKEPTVQATTIDNLLRCLSEKKKEIENLEEKVKDLEEACADTCDVVNERNIQILKLKKKMELEPSDVLLAKTLFKMLKNTIIEKMKDGTINTTIADTSLNIPAKRGPGRPRKTQSVIVETPITEAVAIAKEENRRALERDVVEIHQKMNQPIFDKRIIVKNGRTTTIYKN